MKIIKRLALLFALCMTFAPTTEAQQRGVISVSAWTFQVKDGLPLVVGSELSRYKPDAGEVVAGIPAVPVGALLTGFQVAGCDESAVAGIEATLGFVIGGTFTPLASGSSGIASQPGCTTLSVPLPSSHVTDSRTYAVTLRGGGTSETRYSAVRLLYELQVSAAPSTATFTDVPVGHPYHQFVEAFTRSGISAGCGGGMFCPDRPVTRGELAVFLAAALGLHFPN